MTFTVYTFTCMNCMHIHIYIDREPKHLLISFEFEKLTFPTAKCIFIMQATYVTKQNSIDQPVEESLKHLFAPSSQCFGQLLLIGVTIGI